MQECWVELNKIKCKHFSDRKNDSINSEEAQALISQFGSEEEYWQHESEVYKINLPIEKYLESLKQEYLKNSISTRSNNQEAEETIENYNRYIEEVQSELVKQEQYEIFEWSISCQHERLSRTVP